jgi:hypothetical protein
MTAKKRVNDRAAVKKVAEAIYQRLGKILKAESRETTWKRRDLLVQYFGVTEALVKLLVQRGLTPVVFSESAASGCPPSEDQLAEIDRRLFLGVLDAVESLLGIEAKLGRFQMDFSWRGKYPGSA